MGSRRRRLKVVKALERPSKVLERRLGWVWMHLTHPLAISDVISSKTAVRSLFFFGAW
jgi:hypothetical protein